MEQVMERNTGYRTYHVYDDDGKEIRNPGMLRAISEAQDFIAVWDKMSEG